MEAEQSYSVTQLVQVFRQALIAMVPPVEAIGLPWKDGDAYDEWDSIEGFLFDTFVVCTVRGDLDTFGDSLPFGVYRCGSRRYAGVSWIQVVIPGRTGLYAFVGFGTEELFGGVEVDPLNGKGSRTIGPSFTVPYSDELIFLAQLRSWTGRLTAVGSVTPVESIVSWSADRRH